VTRVSVVVNNYNYAEYLAEAIDSALGHFLCCGFVGNIDVKREWRQKTFHFSVAAVCLAYLAGRTLCAEFVDIGDHDLGACFGKSQTISFADAMGAAGNDDDFLREFFDHSALILE